MKHYIDYMDNISADPALCGKIIRRSAEKPAPKTRATFKYALVASAAALLLGILIMPQAINNWRGPDGQPRVIYYTDNDENEDYDTTSDAIAAPDAYSGAQISPGNDAPVQGSTTTSTP